MRVKQLWNYVPLPANLRLVWDRLTFSRLTTVYFAVAVIHCFIQVIFQISALYINIQAAHTISHIADSNPNSTTGFAVLTKNGPLRSCTGTPGSTGTTPCRMVWTGKVSPDAFGDYPDYSYGNNATASVAASSFKVSLSSSLVASVSVSSIASASITAQTTTIAVPSSPSGAAAVVLRSSSSASQSSVPTSADVTFTSTVVISVAPTTSAFSTSTVSATPLVPGGSPIIPAGPAKRMYIPSHIPGKSHMRSKREIRLTPLFSEFNGSFEGVKLQGLTSQGRDTDEAFVSSVCVQVLQWPLQKLWNTQREDAVFIGFQIWVLGMSIVALLNESVPHIIAAFLTHIMVTAWSVFQIIHTANFRSEFNRITTRGACGGVNLLPTYWKSRANAEVPILVLNVLVLIASAYMSWRLLKTFGWLTFKRVGASLEINQIYKMVLSLGIVLQLSLFFMVVSMALWVEELYHGPAAGNIKLVGLYKAIVNVQLIALVPWLVMGWYAVRREMRKTMIAFLSFSALFIVAWAGMFVSPTWRLTFMTWMFFRIMSVIAVTLTVLASALGVMCWFNFGKDFPKHLKLNEDPEENDFIPAQPSYDPEKAEKFDFPTQNSVPTFSDAFPSRPGSVASDSTQSHSRSESSISITPPRMIARPPVYQSFEVERATSTVGSGIRGSVARTNSMSSRATASVHDPFEQDLVRVTSNSTYPTIRSITSERSASSETAGMGKRWVIE